MPMVRIPNAGSVGVNKDLSQHELPLNAWTDAQNIRFLDGYAYQFYGHGEVYGTPSTAPLHVLPCNVAGGRYWIYAGAGKVYCVTITGGGAVHTDITRASGGDYTATPNSWTSTLLSGLPIMNPGNVLDVPQMWGLSTGTPLVALSNWPASTYCKSLRAFNNSLVAMNVTKGSSAYPFMVKWSHPADPGSVPASWDHTDATKDAGETDLAEGYDPIVDGLQLRDSFMIYKESSVWKMSFIGGTYLYKFQKVLGTSGAMNRNCVVEVDGWHFVLTGSDVIVHDGNSSRSVLDKQSRRYLFQDMDVDQIGKAFVFKNPFLNEVFVCYASIGATTPNKSLVWNYNDKTVSFREIPSLNHAAFGPVDNGLIGNWNQDAGPWSSDLTSWNGPDFTPSTARVLMASAETKLHLLDAAASFNGVAPTAYLERRGLSLDVPEMVKLVRGIRPRIVGSTGETVLIRIGSQTDPWSEPVWGPTMTHTIGTTVCNDCLVSGRYIAVRFDTGTAYQWRLDSYDLDVETVGAW